jgi:hypothetical protein
MPSRLVLSLVVATVAAGLSTTVTDKRDFKEIAVRTVMAEKASGPGSKCPLARESIDSADLNLLSICMAYGLVAYDAAQRYPASAPKIFALYGGEPTFQRILDRYGHQIVPIVASFIDNGSSTYQVHQAADNALRQIWQGNIPKWDANLSREQIGLMAIHEIDERGQGLLAEFEIVDGIAKWKPVTGVMLGVQDFFTGGIQHLETVYVRGEQSLTFGDFGGAALDVAVVFGGVGALAKEVRAADFAVGGRSTAKVLAVNAYRTVRTVGGASWSLGGIGFLYVLAARPSLVASGGGWIADQLGYDRRLGIFAVYFLGTAILLQFLWPLIWCASVIVKVVRRLLSRLRSPRGPEASPA